MPAPEYAPPLEHAKLFREAAQREGEPRNDGSAARTGDQSELLEFSQKSLPLTPPLVQ
jgi:hypothetical protein